MIRLIVVGKTREPFLAEGIALFAERISRFASVKIVEVKDGSMKEEGERIMKALGREDYAVVLDVKGTELSSEELATLIKKNFDKKVAFIIGGPQGLPPAVRERSDLLLSLSRMTYTHEMARLILMEQIYRSYAIINGTGYHKSNTPA